MDEKHDGVGFNVASPVSKRIDPSILRPFGGLRPLQRKTLMSFPQCHVRRPVYLLSMYSPNMLFLFRWKSLDDSLDAMQRLIGSPLSIGKITTTSDMSLKNVFFSILF